MVLGQDPGGAAVLWHDDRAGGAGLAGVEVQHSCEPWARLGEDQSTKIMLQDRHGLCHQQPDSGGEHLGRRLLPQGDGVPAESQSGYGWSYIGCSCDYGEQLFVIILITSLPSLLLLI